MTLGMYAIELMQIWSFCINIKFNYLSSGIRVNKEIKRVGPKSFMRCNDEQIFS